MGEQLKNAACALIMVLALFVLITIAGLLYLVASVYRLHLYTLECFKSAGGGSGDASGRPFKEHV